MPRGLLPPSVRNAGCPPLYVRRSYSHKTGIRLTVSFYPSTVNLLASPVILVDQGFPTDTAFQPNKIGQSKRCEPIKCLSLFSFLRLLIGALCETTSTPTLGVFLPLGLFQAVLKSYCSMHRLLLVVLSLGGSQSNPLRLTFFISAVETAPALCFL